MNREPKNTELFDLVESFAKRAHNDLDGRLSQWGKDLSHERAQEVIGGLLARQLVLTEQLARSPGIWTHDLAPLALRAMADVYISLAWILADPVERSTKFVLHGLGQLKLQLEHRRADLETRKPLEGEIEQIEAGENWINSQRATFLVDVNLGSWSGLTTRQMAEEADCLDFYNYVYSPFSACVHSMWHHLALHNLKTCENPLHRFHQLPRYDGSEIDIHYLYLAAKYLQKTLHTFDAATGLDVKTGSAFDWLAEQLVGVSSEPPTPAHGSE